MKSVGFIFMVALLVGIASGEEPLNAKEVFFVTPMDTQWQALYEEIEGSTFEEKNHHATTTWEMKALSVFNIHQQEIELAEASKALQGILDADGWDLFLKTHVAWRNYIDLQAEFMSDSCRGGSAHALYWNSILLEEMKLRTQLYQNIRTPDPHL